ncbi:MAG: hypothetical protein ACTSPB_25070, partial [Candidatus Thorarchaeota archaeon]
MSSPRLLVSPDFLQSVNVSILPRSDSTYDLGSSSYRWRNGYFAGILNIIRNLTSANQKVITIRDNTTTSGELWIGETTSTTNAFVPRIQGISENRNAYGLMIGGAIPIVNDVYDSLGGALVLIGDTPDGDLLSSANIVNIRNHDTSLLRVRADGTTELQNLRPMSNNTYDLGSSSLRWKNGYFAGFLDIGSLKIGGNEVIDASRILKNIASIAQNLLPDADDTRDLGSSSYRWKTVYAKDYFVFTDAYNEGSVTNRLLTLLTKDAINDVLLFRPPDIYEYDDGSGWITGTVDDSVKNLFTGKRGSFTIPNGRIGVRFTWNGTIPKYTSYVLFFMKLQTTHNSLRVILETSSDGSAWDTVFDKTLGSWNTTLIAKMSKYIGSTERYLRITMYPTWNPSYTSNIFIFMIRMFNQYESQWHPDLTKLFDWDFDKVISFYNTIQPNTDNTYDLGSSSLRWKNGYFGGILYAETNAVIGSGVALPNGIVGELHVGRRKYTSTGNYEVTRIAIQPPFHTGGPFKIVARDEPGNAYLDIRYGTRDLLAIRHDGLIFPKSDNSYDLGSSSYRWKDIYFAGNLIGANWHIKQILVGTTASRPS